MQIAVLLLMAVGIFRTSDCLRGCFDLSPNSPSDFYTVEYISNGRSFNATNYCMKDANGTHWTLIAKSVLNIRVDFGWTVSTNLSCIGLDW